MRACVRAQSGKGRCIKMKTISLNGIWKLKGREEGADVSHELTLDARVPGCVQLDLAEGGYLPSDLFLGENITEAEKYEVYEWWYERSFDAPSQRKNVYLVFEGVDCLAEYYLNGIKIGESDNMLIPHEFCIDGALSDGENTLTVHIRSAVLDACNKDYNLKLLYSDMITDARFIRKPAHSYGWDIMPRAVTAGLWRDVRLEARDDIYFTETFVDTEESRLYYTLNCDVRMLENAEIELVGACGSDSSFYGRSRCKKPFGRMNFDIINPKLWFPYGYGEPNVYDGKVRIYVNGDLVHETDISFGIRDVILERRDAIGSDDGQFRFLINGVEIMCRGSNWVPLDAFHSRDAERYERALALVKDIGCNILRCWGGGVYEDHAFYDFCDRNGIMVWQDFAMACVPYPESDEFKHKIEKEATAIIRRLRSHPSIILWAGDNEVDACNQNRYIPHNNSLTRSVLAKCVELNDFTRPYLPSSPYISEDAYRDGQRSQCGGSRLVEDHLWGPRDYFKSDFYKGNKAHFVSETGYHGCPSLESIKRFITPERVWPYHNNPEWILHSSDQNGNDSRVMLMEKQVRQLFGEVPSDPEEYILASQISQAEAKKYFIERIRVGRPQKTGIIWWNLLDGWPQMSDAVVDYYFTKKLAYSYIKRSQAPFVIAADEIVSWELPIYACNDTLIEKRGEFTVKDASDGKVLYSGDFVAKANTSTLLTKLPIYYSEQRILIFEWSIGKERGFNHYLCGYPPFSYKAYKEVMDKYNF